MLRLTGSHFEVRRRKAMVIERAMKDAVGKNVKLKEEAIKWLNSESFETVCEL